MSENVNKTSGADAAAKERTTRNKTFQPEKYDLHNLRFLGEFMTKMGLTTTKLAEKAGLSQVSIYYWLKKDDAHLSSVEHVLNAWGYNLRLDLVPVADENEKVLIHIFDSSDDRRLSFLERALEGVSREELRKKLGIGKTTIYYWLSHDDISISYITKIAEFLDKQVYIYISPMKG